MVKVSQYVPCADPEAPPVYVLTKDGIKSAVEGDQTPDLPLR